MSTRLPPIPPIFGVTSVGFVDSTGTFNIGGSPITSYGTLSLSSFGTQSPNQVLAGPTMTPAGAAAWRALVAADIPLISLLSGVTGVLPVANGGTGTSTSFSPGNLVFAGAAGVYTSNPYLFWYGTGSSLGIGGWGSVNPGQLLGLYNGHVQFKQIANPGSFTATASTSSGTLPAGTYKYAISFVTASGETALSAAVSATLSSTGEITLSSLPTPLSTDNVTNIRVYRTAAGGTPLFLLTTITPSTSFVDNGTYTPGLVDYTNRDNTTAGKFYLGTLFSAFSGGSNTSFGLNSLPAVTGGFANSVFGEDAGESISTGVANTALGFNSASVLSSGGSNTFVGANSGYQTTTGGDNVGVGYKAGNGLTTGEGNTFLGYNAGTTLDSVENSVAIGTNSNVSASNTIALGGDELIEGSPATAVVINGQSAEAQLQVNMADGATIGIISNGHSDVDCHLQEWQIAGTALGFIDQDANLFSNGIGLTAQYNPTGTPYTVDPTKGAFVEIYNTAAAPFEVNLPTSPQTGQIFVIVDQQGTALTHNINVTPQSPYDLNGSSSAIPINTNFGSLRVRFSAGNGSVPAGWFTF